MLQGDFTVHQMTTQALDRAIVRAKLRLDAARLRADFKVELSVGAALDRMLDVRASRLRDPASVAPPEPVAEMPTPPTPTSA